MAMSPSRRCTFIGAALVVSALAVGTPVAQEHAGPHWSYEGTSGPVTNMSPFTDSSVDLQAVAGAELDRLWGKGLIGLRVDSFEEHGVSAAHSGLDLALATGYDLFNLGPFRCGPAAGVATMLGTFGATSLNLGVVLRN